ncbi:hypothetical protein PGB90_009527 [Kerria lacca]
MVQTSSPSSPQCSTEVLTPLQDAAGEQLVLGPASQELTEPQSDGPFLSASARPLAPASSSAAVVVVVAVVVAACCCCCCCCLLRFSSSLRRSNFAFRLKRRLCVFVSRVAFSAAVISAGSTCKAASLLLAAKGVFFLLFFCLSLIPASAMAGGTVPGAPLVCFLGLSNAFISLSLGSPKISPRLSISLEISISDTSAPRATS